MPSTPAPGRGGTAALLPLLSVLLALCLWGCGPASAPRTGGAGVDKPYTVRGTTYYPLKSAAGFEQEGVASWYGPGFHGRLTSSGEVYNQNDMTAAHTVLPFQSQVQVTNLSTGKTAVVRINDRGPFASGRIIDLSKAAAQQLDVIGPGTARVRIRAAGSGAPVQAAPAVQPQMATGSIYVQLGAFAERSNAERLSEKIRAQGYTVRMSPGPRNLLRVLAGPWPNLNDANEHLWQLRSDYPEAFLMSADL